MANIYLSSVDGSDVDDGSTWALAKATLAAALTAAGAGGRVYADSAHSESFAAATTFTSPGTFSSPTLILSVNRAGNPEPPTAMLSGATIRTTTSNDTIVINGSFVMHGFVFITDVATSSLGFGNTPTVTSLVVLKDVKFSPAAAGLFILGAVGDDSQNIGTVVIATDCVMDFGVVGNGIEVRGGGYVELRGLTFPDAIPTTLFVTPAFGTSGGKLRVVGCDFSAFGSGKTLVDLAVGSQDVIFSDCKLGGSVALTTGTGNGTKTVTFVNCDSADTNYRFHRQNSAATETQETTIVRTGGASDGTTTFSRKIVTTANVTPHFAYTSMPIEFWRETVGSAITVTVPIITDNVTLTDAEVWIEVEYLGTSGFPLGLFANDRVSDPIFGTPANQTTNTDTWTTTGLTTPVKQQLSVSITPQEKGIVRVSVCVAKASTTVYYDPLAQVS